MNINRFNEKATGAARVNKNKDNISKIKGKRDATNSGKIALFRGSKHPTISIPIKEITSTTTKIELMLAQKKRPTNHVPHHAPENHPVLKRTNVNKPGAGLKRRLRVSTATDSLVSRSVANAVTPYDILGHKREQREQRAAFFRQSDRINHFIIPSESQALQLSRLDSATPQPVPQLAEPAPSKSPTDVLLERALLQANSSPDQPPTKPNKANWHRITLVAIPLVVLGLFIVGATEFTNLQLRQASAKTGFTTSLPAYHPAGFSLGQMSYNSGIFASEFHSKNNNQTYTVTQRSSSWNTQELLNSYVSSTDPNYQVIQLGSRTIYLYGIGNATWVSKGVWYQINSDGSLNESQLIDVANSL